MPGPQVDALAEMIRKALPSAGSLDQAVENVRAQLAAILKGLDIERAAELAEAREVVSKEFDAIEILYVHSLVRKRPKWYFGSKPVDLHWPALSRYLSQAKGWSEDSVEAINTSSNEVVSLLENPIQNTFSCRGLVVGYVQSGKTANMTAVMAKALDAGYNTIIVLAGLTNKLRFQTQLRLVTDLVQRHPLHWQVLTPTSVVGDFRAPAYGGFLSHTDKAQLAVVKKNVSPLNQLKEAIQRTLPAALARLRILVIDDECDQASVNSASDELNMTVINQRIRELLNMLPAVTYVGYTATPFANVLTNPFRVDTVEGRELDDLYPRDFITPLPYSKGYFGAEQLFGKVPIDANADLREEEGLDMIRIVPDIEQELLQPLSRSKRDEFQPRMAPSLETALVYFLGCCSARRARGDVDQHMTMLVHTSAFISMHDKLAVLIKGWLDVNGRQVADRNSKFGKQLESVWESESGRLPDDITESPKVPIEEIFKHLPSVLEKLEVPVENGASDERIDYTGAPKTYIVVGGSILARGLTLEGLMVSYFLRSANQYDTLLQMGRWFGYRPNYEDLPRIWTTNDLKLKFRELAGIETEIRSEIDAYRRQDLTPMDLAVRIRAIPGMAITAANKMRAAHDCAVSYWGTHRQTFRFEHRNRNVLERNWKAAAELLSRAEELGLRDRNTDAKIWRKVPKSSIIRFVELYQPHSTQADLSRTLLNGFINGADARLDTWNIGVVEPKHANTSTKSLGTIGKVRLVTRSKLKDEGATDADIKALMSRIDVTLDCAEKLPANLSWDEIKEARLAQVGQVPLLLLYPIDKNSPPTGRGDARIALDALEDVIGYGVVFPGSKTEGGNYVSVRLDAPSADELNEINTEEKDQAEAAGV